MSHSIYGSQQCDPLYVITNCLPLNQSIAAELKLDSAASTDFIPAFSVLEAWLVLLKQVISVSILVQRNAKLMSMDEKGFSVENYCDKIIALVQSCVRTSDLSTRRYYLDSIMRLLEAILERVQ